MRRATITCDLCGTNTPLERAKEALFQRNRNEAHLMDLCSECLDAQLQVAETVNDTQGYRQRVAALVRLPDDQVPEHITRAT